MNERHPYERHLAEKLQNLPPPGEVDPSWDEMRKLLDNEMPGGGAVPSRRRWWLFMIAAGVLFLGTWLSGRQLFDKQDPAGVAQTTTLGGATQAGKDQTTSSGDRTGVSTSNDAPEHPTTASTPADGAQSSSAPDSRQVPGRGEPALRSDEDLAVQTEAAPPTRKGNALTGNSNKASSPASVPISRATRNGQQNQHDHEPNADEAIITQQSRTQKKNNNTSTRKGAGHGPHAVITGNQVDPAPAAQEPAKSASQEPAEPAATFVQAPEHYATMSRPVLPPGTTIEKDYARKKAKLPEAVSKAKPRKITHTAQKGTLAMGFSLPLAFPLGAQKAMGYNVWGGHNTVSDYLPSPHVQYHVSDKTFFQTEAQLLSPQFIPTTLLSQYTRSNANYTMTSSIYARKLYYFNVPLSVHHSPFPGFYMGTGVQFSSMLSGVALTEDRKWIPGTGEQITQTYSRFRNDTLSAKMNTSEFRVLLDANYYFNKFTVGLRYNQALTNYINSQLMPGSPYTFEKNRALQFYLRYNLWEERRKATSGKQLLSLK